MTAEHRMKKEIQDMYLSPIRDISSRASQLSSRGLPVVSFGAGDTVFDTPEPVKQAAIKALTENRSHYETIRGNSVLRQKIAARYKADYGLEYNEDEILITAAGTESIFDTFLALISPGDEVIVVSPAFINYENCITLAGGKTVSAPVRESDGFEPDADMIESLITERTRMLVINNPCNPTGVVYSKKCVKRLAALAVKYDFLVFSDEVYDRIIYDGFPYTPIASFPGMRERTIIANSFSKMLAMTGWRIGYLAACGGIMEALFKVHHYSTACQPTFIQDALAGTIDLPATDDALKRMVDSMNENRRRVTQWLKSHPCLSAVEPKGAFYYFIKVSGCGMSGREFTSRLLEEKYVAVIPGEGLGKDFPDYIRLSYAVKEDTLEEGLARIDCFLDEIAQ
jgi:aminotransferase